MSESNESTVLTKTETASVEQVNGAIASPVAANLVKLRSEQLTAKVKTLGDLINAEQFTPEERGLAEQESLLVNFEDDNTLMLYGAAHQKQLSSHLDTLIADARVKDTGIAGQLTLDLARGYDVMKIAQLKQRLKGLVPGALAKLFLGAMDLVDLVRYLKDNYEKISALIDQIEEKGVARQRVIVTYNTKLQSLREQSEVFIKAMSISLAGGEIALLRGIAEYDRRLTLLRAGHADDLEPARLNSLGDSIALFETRLVRMQVAYTRSLAVTISRIDGIKKTGTIEISNIIEVLLSTLPQLKDLVLQVSSLSEIEQAQQEAIALRAKTADIESVGSELFEKTYLAAIESQGGVLDDVRRLAATADSLIATINEGKELEKQNMEKRLLATSELVDVKAKVQEALTAVHERPSAKQALK